MVGERKACHSWLPKSAFARSSFFQAGKSGLKTSHERSLVRLTG
jgi:hypothetical protein